MIKTEYQAIIQCDVCGETQTYAWMSQKEAIEDARREGWKIGKKVTCLRCQPISQEMRTDRSEGGVLQPFSAEQVRQLRKGGDTE